MFIEVVNYETGQTEPINLYDIAYFYKKENDDPSNPYVVVYKMVSGITYLEGFASSSDADAKLEDLSEAVAGGGLSQFDTYGDFPDEGNKSMVYIAKDTGQTYYWDENTSTYITTGTSGRTGVYAASVDLNSTIGASTTVNKTDLTVLVTPTVAYSEGSEVVGVNSTHGLITAIASSSVTVKTIPDNTIDSFVQVASESSLPQIGQENILYYLQDTDTFRTWDATAQDYVAPDSGGVIPYFDSTDFSGSTDIGNTYTKPLDFSELKMGLNIVQVNQSKSSFYYKYNWNGTEKTASTLGIKDLFTDGSVYWKSAIITMYVDPSDFSVYTNSYQPLGDVKFISPQNSCTQYFIYAIPNIQIIGLNYPQTYVLAAEANTALNKKEDTSNKVTSISNQSTDTQYPSAKCVYDAIYGALNSNY